VSPGGALILSCVNRRQHNKHTIRTKSAIGSQHMDVRVECQQIVEGLNEQDQPRTTLHPGAGVGRDQQMLASGGSSGRNTGPCRKARAGKRIEARALIRRARHKTA
jgi:hypothetical protein